MLVESICIVLILALLSITFFRRGQRNYSLITTTLLILPLEHIITQIVSELTNIVFTAQTRTLWDLAFVAVSQLLLGCLANQIKNKKSRVVYCVMGFAFVLILGVIFVLNNFKIVS